MWDAVFFFGAYSKTLFQNQPWIIKTLWISQGVGVEIFIQHVVEATCANF